MKQTGSVHDWASRCAKYIAGMSVTERKNASRIAAVIETFAKPMLDVLRDAQRSHRHNDEERYYCCPKCDECFVTRTIHPSLIDKPCDCGAKEFNARLKDVLQ